MEPPPPRMFGPEDVNPVLNVVVPLVVTGPSNVLLPVHTLFELRMEFAPGLMPSIDQICTPLAQFTPPCVLSTSVYACDCRKMVARPELERMTGLVLGTMPAASL